MELKSVKENNELTVQVCGRIDAKTAPQLLAYLEENIADIETLVLDFSDVVYISSAGLRVILVVQTKLEEQAGTMVIRNCSPEISSIFKITGFDSFLTLE